MSVVRRSPLPSVGVVVLVLSAFAMFQPGAGRVRAADEPPKPAQKDSSTRAKPKEASLSLAVEPAEARPGETVSLKVTAKLKPGWHIYTQAKTQQGDGPRKTIFDLFDTASLEVAGDWKASRKPESKSEPAFDNQVFEYFEDEVTWSIPLKIPAGTPAGKKEIRCQASFQICNAQKLQLSGTMDPQCGPADDSGGRTGPCSGDQARSPAATALAGACKEG